MDINQVIRHFSTKTEVPIEPNDVKKFILSDGMDLVIRFIGVELDVDVLRGHLAQSMKLAPLYGEDTRIADVYYALNQSSDWKRLVIVKELTHTLDPEEVRTAAEGDLQTLVNRMALAPEFQNLAMDQKEGGMKVVADRLAVVTAVAITFPWAVRELVRPKVLDGTLNEGDVARLVDIPLSHVRLVLSDDWPTIYALLIS